MRVILHVLSMMSSGGNNAEYYPVPEMLSSTKYSMKNNKKYIGLILVIIVPRWNIENASFQLGTPFTNISAITLMI